MFKLVKLFNVQGWQSMRVIFKRQVYKTKQLVPRPSDIDAFALTNEDEDQLKQEIQTRQIVNNPKSNELKSFKKYSFLKSHISINNDFYYHKFFHIIIQNCIQRSSYQKSLASNIFFVHSRLISNRLANIIDLKILWVYIM